MRIVAHTKYGVFYGIEEDCNESSYREVSKFLERLGTAEYFSFGTDDGEIYLTKAMIDDSVFILDKGKSLEDFKNQSYGIRWDDA